ncbi:hypothetical protein J4208_01075 [Candidatus Woesearchaeota archaeon]|nr:hypothetical protein [Candidatus Woesearchaeota archaeon]
MADLVTAQFEKKEGKDPKGDLAKNKVLAPGKFGLGKAQYRMVIDSPVAGVEGIYFWIIHNMEDKPPFGFNYTGETGEIKKIKDIYTAGETSSYWGMSEQRKGVQQDKFQQLMANVGQLLKTLFQLLRELRIIEERLEFYKKSEAGDRSSEVALKSIWVDLVEGGSKNAASVLGLGTQVGFVTLPDLFFSVHPKTPGDVDREVDKLEKGGFNRKVREVLGRKLTQYLTWKEKTYKELRQGYEFKLKYLRQHYHVIKLYLNWLRPYLQNVQRLQMQDTRHDKEIIAAFETSRIQLEVIGIKRQYEEDGEYGKQLKKFEEFFPVVRVKIDHVAMPEIAYQTEGQRGAIHRGRTILTIEAFVAQVVKDSDGNIIRDDIKEYEQKLEGEDMELLAAVDASILALKDDLEYYLIQGGDIKKKEEEEAKKDGPFNPFKHLFLGFKELAQIPTKNRGKKSKNLGEKGSAEKIAKSDAYIIYNLYKKTHGMFAE